MIALHALATHGAACAASEPASSRPKASMSERILAESDGEAAARIAENERQGAIKAAREAEVSCFYCEVCDKQYHKVNVATARRPPPPGDRSPRLV